MVLPTAATPGYTLYRDASEHGWVACYCLAEWLKWYERVLLARGLIKSNIDVWQLTGGASASAGTHSQGGAFDLLYQTTDAHVAVAREMGAPATWRRTTAQGFSRTHAHGVLSDCAHNEPARYQIAAQYAGRDGLGWRGMQGPDTHARPSTYRSWREGIEWAKKEVARLTSTPAPAPKPAPSPVPEEDFMASIDDLMGTTFKGADGARFDDVTVATWRNVRALIAQSAAEAGRDAALLSAIKALSSGQPVDLAAVQAAAKAGTEAALKGYQLTLSKEA